MALIKSISGIRGTIGGIPGENLTPIDVVRFAGAFAAFLRSNSRNGTITVVVGRDARISGEMVSRLAIGTLMGMGIDILDIGLTTTPTLELAVPDTQAAGGIMITASHNPKQWNALKLINKQGEFLSAEDGERVVALAGATDLEFAPVGRLGHYRYDDSFISKHIERIIQLPLVNIDAIKKADYHIVADVVNSTGALAVPVLLERLGVRNVDVLFGEPTGDFAHQPEPLPENLSELAAAVVRNKAHLGFAVDPDVDRLAVVQEDGEMFGEEYTLVAVADYVLKHQKGNTVSNLSSTIALKEITDKAGCTYYASAVGEVNVVNVMKSVEAVIGGEGNGGVIYPELHYGRDALAGMALFLSHLATSGRSCSSLRSTLPSYHISKNKVHIPQDVDLEQVFHSLRRKYAHQPLNEQDGLRIEFGREWVHLRKSNTEPILRIYAESDSQVKSDVLAKKITTDIGEVIRLNGSYPD